MNGLFNKHMSTFHFPTSFNRRKIWKGEWRASKRAGRLRVVIFSYPFDPFENQFCLFAWLHVFSSVALFVVELERILS